MSLPLNTSSTPKAENAYRVMVVDDSAVIRGLLTRMLENDPKVSVIESVSNGEIAIKRIATLDVDVVVLDIEMPVMDGLTALPKLLEAKPGVQIIMASTLTRKNAEISFKAMRLGAADYIPKPTSSGELTKADDFKYELVEKVKALGRVARTARHAPLPSGASATVAKTGAAGQSPAQSPAGKAADPIRRTTGGLYANKEISLRTTAIARPDILAIGSSTGGPQALFDVLGNLGVVSQPVVITQHMPATFTALLAEHIGRISQMPSKEGEDGEAIRGGRIYLAPGGYHMVFEKKGTDTIIRLNQEPPENFCRPAVDPMLRSLSKIYGSHLLVLILTGMGSDGLRGSEVVTTAGGSVIAQDEHTSVVWGMPGAVATAGLCSAVLPIKEMAAHVRQLVLRSAA
ncbi:chemotaxis response regulator protein-glutamate methylesterase [Kiloniella laminariae]|uniref:Protein-glutamate methylesterase/protein-glutamine glutaminase n=1 Tax=Kiloniella laminariae TaxID=454162 RepID=A0ABT4LHF6_9PROT|nr:chemotaxis response regulator protein-glutamate methylesterase [Kiloniella laminariae]MCZ4280537.1 chemotaxis response regulator protein-glutamate methylesterase [Kiloniella laminariae]